MKGTLVLKFPFLKKVIKIITLSVKRKINGSADIAELERELERIKQEYKKVSRRANDRIQSLLRSNIGKSSPALKYVQSALNQNLFPTAGYVGFQKNVVAAIREFDKKIKVAEQFLNLETSSLKNLQKSIRHQAEILGLNPKGNLSKIARQLSSAWNLNSKVLQYLSTMNDLPVALDYLEVGKMIQQYIQTGEYANSHDEYDYDKLNEDDIEDLTYLAGQYIATEMKKKTLQNIFDALK